MKWTPWGNEELNHKFIKLAFIPEPDIAVYELAEILSYMTCEPGYTPRNGAFFREDMWPSIPAGIKRHFKVKED